MNERFSVNAEQLRKKHLEKCNNRTRIYEKILERCYLRVNNASNNDKNYTLFTIPEFILGMPTYNLAYCGAYIIYDLRKKGFNAKFFNPNIILVTWDYESPSYLKNETKQINYQPKVSNTLQIEAPKKFRSIKDYKPSGHFIN